MLQLATAGGAIRFRNVPKVNVRIRSAFATSLDLVAMSTELSDLDLANFEKQTTMAGSKRNSDTAGIDSLEDFQS